MLKDIWSKFDFKGIVEESGIFTAILILIIALFISILVLPVIPFYAFNEWSKSWFGGNFDD